jgi:hypothetical protein
MTIPTSDLRNDERRELDEQIAAEPKLPLPKISPDSASMPVEAHLAKLRQPPLAMAGIVENGLVRPLNPAIKLPEHARVIIVATEVS